MAKRITKLPSLSSWQAALLRLTAFPSPVARFDNQNWWQQVVGDAPETITTQPRLGGVVTEGTYSDCPLTLSTHPTRIDWVYGSREITNPVAELADITIGTFQDSLKIFTVLMNRWFALLDVPSLVRLAFGAVLLQPADSGPSAYENLSRYLGHAIDLEGARDFNLQINRRRDSKRIPSLKINRLARWSVFVVKQEVIAPSTPRSSYPSAEFYACRLELDINTDVDYEGELHPKQLPQLFSELTSLGEEIALKGDLP
jgi:hypothetical protein